MRSEMFRYLFYGKELEDQKGWTHFRGTDPHAGTRWVTLKGEGHTYTLREQNPNTSSRYAAMAREGQKIAWLFIDGSYADKEALVREEEVLEKLP